MQELVPASWPGRSEDALEQVVVSRHRLRDPEQVGVAADWQHVGGVAGHLDVE